jgi:hypothetical protein
LEGLDQFKLEVILITEHYFVNLELALEQYFLLHPEYNLNTLKLVNDFSGSRSKPIYMYNSDYSKLIYYSDITEEFIFKLGIHYNTLTRCLKNEELYLGKYRFSDKPVVTSIESDFSIKDINNILDIDRTNIQNAKGRKIIISSIDNIKDIRRFETISACVKYLNTIDTSSKTTLYRHIKSGRPYQGYICKLEDDQTLAFFDKSIQVSITHVPTNVTNIYPSFRKAALSFAPKYKTTGQTLVAFAESGNLFKNEYKIETKNNNVLNLIIGYLVLVILGVIASFVLVIISILADVDVIDEIYDYSDNVTEYIPDDYDIDIITETLEKFPKKERNLLDYNPDDESNYFPDNSDYLSKREAENEREKMLLESIQCYVQAESTNKSVIFTENSPISQSDNLSPLSTNTDIVNQIRSEIDVILTPSTTQNTPIKESLGSSSIEENLESNSIILPPIPNNTPISPKAIIIPTNHVAEGEPIPPLPL